jgi:predicted amidohydrolase/predicted NUDIX family NTP pyrophosphohydrolase
MRLLLAAVECAKGGVDANLRRHVGLLEEAAGAGCDLAVFPEFSLTGSVDPGRHPERALPVDAGPVRELVAETRRAGVAAVFGIAERSAERFHIAQLYAHDGRLDGVYRKRHLGEGEERFEVGGGPGVFRFGAASFGVTICAEGEVDFPWEDVAHAGAPLVLFCSAPGLDGRRTGEAGWRAGHRWWCSAGLGDAVRHARRLGVWVAMATQAGSTEDEDFPGLAALVRPDGEVTARLPDWRPGTLVVDVPVPVTVEPVREAVRVLVVDESHRALLVRFADAAGGPGWWAPPGGGLEPGEDHLAATRRELREELGRDELAVGPWIGHCSHTFETVEAGRWMTQRERWALCRTSRFEVDPGRVAWLRREGIDGLRWWSADELRTAGALTTPRRLAQLLDDLRGGRVPAADENLRV